jgi:hypothetical protein
VGGGGGRAVLHAGTKLKRTIQLTEVLTSVKILIQELSNIDNAKIEKLRGVDSTRKCQARTKNNKYTVKIFPSKTRCHFK